MLMKMMIMMMPYVETESSWDCFMQTSPHDSSTACLLLIAFLPLLACVVWEDHQSSSFDHQSTCSFITPCLLIITSLFFGALKIFVVSTRGGGDKRDSWEWRSWTNPTTCRDIVSSFISVSLVPLPLYPPSPSFTHTGRRGVMTIIRSLCRRCSLQASPPLLKRMTASIHHHPSTSISSASLARAFSSISGPVIRGYHHQEDGRYHDIIRSKKQQSWIGKRWISGGQLGAGLRHTLGAPIPLDEVSK